MLWSPETEYFFILNIMVYILYVHFYKWTINNFFLRWFTVCEIVACFSLFPYVTFFSKSLGNISYVVYYSLLAAYRRMISSPSTLVATLFTSHVETAPVDQSAQLKIANIRSLVTSHMEDLKQWLRMSPQVLNLGQSCSTIVNLFAVNGALMEKHKGSKINLWGIWWE